MNVHDQATCGSGVIVNISENGRMVSYVSTTSDCVARPPVQVMFADGQEVPTQSVLLPSPSSANAQIIWTEPSIHGQVALLPTLNQYPEAPLLKPVSFIDAGGRSAKMCGFIDGDMAFSGGTVSRRHGQDWLIDASFSSGLSSSAAFVQIGAETVVIGVQHALFSCRPVAAIVPVNCYLRLHAIRLNLLFPNELDEDKKDETRETHVLRPRAQEEPLADSEGSADWRTRNTTQRTPILQVQQFAQKEPVLDLP